MAWLDPRLGGQLGGEGPAGGGDGGVVDVAVRGRHQQDEVGLARVEHVLEDLAGPGGLGGRVVEPAGGQVLGHPPPMAPANAKRITEAIRMARLLRTVNCASRTIMRASSVGVLTYQE